MGNPDMLGPWAFQGYALTREQTLDWTRHRKIDLGPNTGILSRIDQYFQQHGGRGYCVTLNDGAPGHPDAAYLFVSRMRLVNTAADAKFKRDARQRAMWRYYFGDHVGEFPELKDVPLVAIYDPARGLFAPLLKHMMYENPDLNELRGHYKLYNGPSSFLVSQHSELRHELLETGDAELIEDSDRDSSWGVGADRKGRNELGKALMVIRQKMRDFGAT